MSKIHKLKLVQPFFDDVWIGSKTFEIRKNDRDYKVGDILTLCEYNEVNQKETDRYIVAEITYILKEYFSISNGFVVMSIDVLQWHTNEDYTI